MDIYDLEVDISVNLDIYGLEVDISIFPYFRKMDNF